VQVERNTGDDLLAVTGLQSRFLAVGGVLAGLSVLLMLLPLHFLGRSLARMKEAARRIQAGELATRVEVESQDEIGELAMAFNHMAEAVEGHVRRQEEIAADLRGQKAELRRESERLAAVIASMRDGLLVLDGHGRPVLSNPAGRPLGRLKDGAGLQPTPHHVCRDGKEGVDCAGCLFEVESPPRACVVDIDQSVYEVQTTRLPPDEGGRCGRVLVARDITDRVRQDERQIHHERLAVIGEVAAVMWTCWRSWTTWPGSCARCASGPASSSASIRRRGAPR
jgi:two-component system sensor histidine kinase ResE